MTTIQMFQEEVRSSEVILAFYPTVGSKAALGTAGRVVSGLLKAAAKRGEIKAIHGYGRVTGSSVKYVMTQEQLDSIRAKAIARAATIA